ncbi:hypothetical protein P153DRAFT_365069 [Dothidotthia symphoricarpi CBS 119687]|uniref:Uncharacterized protein n=1 Tax=Dothidotthia symphoricarpi CBS 119687 TaxID=1392245 RepID=A0A6A6AKU2_9PLEO|nr:uncharacterized protein P153DRAFT_365069 [Dothidotthia symphoricarpi CBS 119687]KAF2131487.1 hypothetical protein P153DRAFT_365069 [Dothidotthia symphoricarpi CBS 119687]
MTNLTTLPPEILFTILSFASPSGVTTAKAPVHPFNTIAATNKYLYTIVEEYTRGLLKQHTGFTPPKSSKTFTCRKKWVEGTCQVCKKSSKRRATLNRVFTCCRTCDRKCFPKLTMTQAREIHNLSKLDLFTPNRLHPSLPPLAVGEVASMGGTATMISEADIITRRELIHSRLGEVNSTDAVYLRRRCAAHERLIAHMDILYNCRYRTWAAARRFVKKDSGEESTRCKSMLTKESREEYVEKGLWKEWAAMRMGGSSEEDAVDIG